MPLEWEDSDLANGGFEMGSLSSWTTVTGSPQITNSTFIEGNYYVRGGASSALDVIKQVITLPADARAFELSGAVGCNTSGGWDLGALALKFFNSTSAYIGGAWISPNHEAVTSYFEYFTSKGLVPDDAATAEVWVYLARYTGTGNNGCADDIGVRWLVGEEEISKTDNQVTNGGFEVGDFSGWTQLSGSPMLISTSSAFKHSGTYAARGGDVAFSLYKQSIVPPPNAIGFVCTAWLSSSTAQIDRLTMRVIARGANVVTADTFEVHGPLSHINQVAASIYEELPAGTAYLELQIDMVRNEGAELNVGIDDIELYWITDDSIVGQVSGTVRVGGVAVVRDLIAISYEKQSVAVGEDYEYRRIVVGEATSSEDGTYTVSMPGFVDEVIVLALENYGSTWQPDTDYVSGDRVRPTVPSGYAYDITVGGNSGATEPAWWTDGSDAIGAATGQAVEIFWSVAHAPLSPDILGE
jgi:hypothetical protein